VRIQIDRANERLWAEDADIHFRGIDKPLPGDRPQQIRWVVEDGLLPDEVLVIFGKPLDWNGPQAPGPNTLTLVETPFCSTLTMSRSRTEILSGPPVFEFPHGAIAVGWFYGIVLIRGEDTPIVVDPLVRIHRA
jgi:hypothetical protein